MKKTSFLKLFVLVMLIAALALSTIACNGGSRDQDRENEEITFTFEVYLKDGTLKSTHEITTDKETVGEALLEKGLIAGDDGDFGLYVKTVDGVFAEYEATGTYWAFYVDGEYAMTGVDTTCAEEGKIYSFRVE